MNSKKILARQIAKYTIYFVLVVAMYILQSAPGFMKIFGIKPVFVVPFCVSLAITEDKWQTGIIFLTGGLLTDLSRARTTGYFTILLIILCVLCMIGVKFIFKPNNRNSYVFSFAVMMIMLTFDFVFTYVMYGYKGLLNFYLRQVLALSAYSAIFGVFFYILLDRISTWRYLRTDVR